MFSLLDTNLKKNMRSPIQFYGMYRLKQTCACVWTESLCTTFQRTS